MTENDFKILPVVIIAKTFLLKQGLWLDKEVNNNDWKIIAKTFLLKQGLWPI